MIYSRFKTERNTSLASCAPRRTGRAERVRRPSRRPETAYHPRRAPGCRKCDHRRSPPPAFSDFPARTGCFLHGSGKNNFFSSVVGFRSCTVDYRSSSYTNARRSTMTTLCVTVRHGNPTALKTILCVARLPFSSDDTHAPFFAVHVRGRNVSYPDSDDESDRVMNNERE